MYSLIIAEDEFTTRRALVNMVQWNKLGFQVDGEFSDGSGVIEYLKNNVPDVILTDIKMTSVGGMEIAHLVQKHNLPIRIVLLSAYKEFSFAQEAVECGVAHYLLKPVDLSDLRSVFMSIKEKLDEQNVQMFQQREKAERYSRLISYEKQQFVTDIYLGALKEPNQIAHRLELIDATFEQGRKVCLIALEIILKDDDNYRRFLKEHGRQNLEEQLSYILGCLEKNMEFYPIIWNNTDKDEFKVLGVLWATEFESKQNCQIERIQEVINNWMRLCANITIYQPLESLEELACMTEKIGKSESQDYLVQDLEYLEVLREQSKLLCSYVYQNKLEQGIELSNSLINNCLRGGVAFAQRQIIWIVIKLVDEIARDNLLVRNELYTYCMELGGFELLQPGSLKVWLEECVCFLFGVAEKHAKKREGTNVEKILAYLQQHYNEDVTLTSISENVFLNPTYVSRLIKKELGKNYTEILMELRIEHAVELLMNSDMYVYDIAETVGYMNLKYFYKVFRKVTGKSPCDYRRGDAAYGD